MKIGRQDNRSTAICTSNPDTIVVRGHDLCADLIGKISFTEHIWLLVVGSLPSAGQRAVLDATLVAIAEHGFVPSVQAARMTLAASPESLQGAVAAGILGCGSVILGSSEAAGRFFAEVVGRCADQAPTDAALGGAGRAAVQELRAAKRPIPGYGHPEHKRADPRAHRLFEIARANALFGVHSRAAHLIEASLPELTGKALAMNVSAAIPAVLLDAGFPLLGLKGVPMLARTASLIAHLIEEQQTPVGFVLSGAAAEVIEYRGAVPSGFAPAAGRAT